MKIEIDEEVLSKTTECKKGFSCLSSKTRDICKVRSKLESAGAEMILFCEPNNDKHCDYKKPFGDFCICECPTRKEIYNRYGI